MKTIAVLLATAMLSTSAFAIDTCVNYRKEVEKFRVAQQKSMDEWQAKYGRPLMNSVEDSPGWSIVNQALTECELNKRIVQAQHEGKCNEVTKVPRYDRAGYQIGYGCRQPDRDYNGPILINIYVYKK